MCKTFQYHIWAATAGNKRHHTYKVVTNGIALAHLLLIIGFFTLRSKCFLTSRSDESNMSVRIFIAVGVALASTYYARLIARVMHRAMFSFLRHRQAATYLSALLDVRTAAKLHIPYIDLTDLDCYPHAIFAWSELRHILLQQVVYARSHRASVVIGVSIILVVATVAVNLIETITKGGSSAFYSENKCDVGFYCTILDIVILVMYLYQILNHVTNVNKSMRFHRKRLAALKFVIEQHQWMQPAMEELQIEPPRRGSLTPPRRGSSTASLDFGGSSNNGRKERRPTIISTNWMREHNLHRWIATRKAVSLLEALREHLEGRDLPVKVLGIEVDKTTVLQLFVFIFVCTVSQIVEVFSGILIFDS